MESLPVPYSSLYYVDAEVIDTPTISGGYGNSDTFKDYYFPNRQRIAGAHQLIDMWLESQRIKSEQTQRSYRQVVCELLQWLEVRYNLPDLRLCNLAHLQFFLAYLKDEKPHLYKGKDGQYHSLLDKNGDPKIGLGKNAIAKYVCAMRSLWKFGCKQSIGYFPLNIAEELAVSWDDKTAERVLSERKVYKLDDTAKEFSQRHWVLFTLLYYSGCRVGEIGRVTSKNPKTGKTEILNPGLYWQQLREQTNSEGDTEFVLTIVGKRNKTRTIVLDAETSEVLLALRGDARDDNPVFPSLSHRDKGQALSDRGIRLMMQEVADKAEIKFSPHWLRHTHATHAKKKGASDFDIMAQLGHTSSTMTSRYIKLSGKQGTSHILRK
jgi:integrase/recombinase XerD